MPVALSLNRFSTNLPLIYWLGWLFELNVMNVSPGWPGSRWWFLWLTTPLRVFCVRAGPTGVGLNELKRKLLISDPQRFSVTIPRKLTQSESLVPVVKSSVSWASSSRFHLSTNLSLLLTSSFLSVCMCLSHVWMCVCVLYTLFPP